MIQISKDVTKKEKCFLCMKRCICPYCDDSTVLCQGYWNSGIVVDQTEQVVAIKDNVVVAWLDK